MWNPATCDFEYNKPSKIGNYLDIKKCSCEKCLFDKLVLACADDTLNTTTASLNDKK